MKIKLLLLLNCCWQLLASAQNSDCNTALVIADTVYYVKVPANNFGKTRELVQRGKLDSTAFKMEKNSHWFIINIPVEEQFTFDLIPDVADDDYDFMLFDAGLPGICDSVKMLGKINVLRSNISRNDKSLNSRTGLSDIGEKNHVGIGIGNAYSKTLTSVAGKSYYLVVCHDRTPKAGFTLKLHHKPVVPAIDPTLETLKWLEQEMLRNRNKLTIVCKDSSGLLNSHFIYHYEGSDTFYVRNNASVYTIPFREPVHIAVSATGYLMQKKIFRPLPDSTGVKDTIYLIPVKVGDYIRYDEFYFEGNTAEMLPKSKPALENLLIYLEQNPQLTVEIEGHVNGPLKKNSREFRKLSEDRAYAVRKFLMWRGIKKNRIKVEGYGNSRMLYPEPVNDEQGEKNRRVEVKIIDIKK